MPFINHATREINCKIAYCGPGLGGKATNLQHIHDQTAPECKGKLMALGEGLYFDYLPEDLGTVGGFRARFHLYTVPSLAIDEATQPGPLDGTDGIVFVADSRESRREANAEALQALKFALLAQSRDLQEIPFVLQLNKRDLTEAVPSGELGRALRIHDALPIEAIASQGIGVLETLKGALRLTLADLRSH